MDIKTIKKGTKLITFDSTEGAGKGTVIDRLYDELTARGLKVLLSKEPGTSLSPVTMILRGVVLDAKHKEEMTDHGREMIMAAVRSITLKNVIIPAFGQYDIILQDRGLLASFAYGLNQGASEEELEYLNQKMVCAPFGIEDYRQLYDLAIYFDGDAIKNLARAQSAKKEFEAGDAIEALGGDFMSRVNETMRQVANRFTSARINVDGKNKDEVYSEVLELLKTKGII